MKQLSSDICSQLHSHSFSHSLSPSPSLPLSLSPSPPLSQVSLIRAGPVGCTRTTYLTIELDTASLPNAKTMQTIIKPTI